MPRSHAGGIGCAGQSGVERSLKYSGELSSDVGWESGRRRQSVLVAATEASSTALREQQRQQRQQKQQKQRKHQKSGERIQQQKTQTQERRKRTNQKQERKPGGAPRLKAGDTEEDFNNPTGIELMFLGTQAATPSIGSNVTSMCLRLDGSLWLFDCGEGTQHQFMKTRLKLRQVEGIFITHTHGDHIFGLPGLIIGTPIASENICTTVSRALAV